MIPKQSLKAAAFQKGNITCLPHQHCLSIVYSLLYGLGTGPESTSPFCLSSHTSVGLSLVFVLAWHICEEFKHDLRKLWPADIVGR